MTYQVPGPGAIAVDGAPNRPHRGSGHDGDGRIGGGVGECNQHRLGACDLKRRDDVVGRFDLGIPLDGLGAR